MSGYELAQLNIARMREPLDSPLMSDFVANLDRVNALADSSAGFVWRLQTPEGNATDLHPLGTDTLINMSVWKDIESLRNFVYRSGHAQIMRRRREWFEKIREAYVVLWWVPAGYRPSVEEAIVRLEALRTNGPGESAFTFQKAYDPPDSRQLSPQFTQEPDLTSSSATT